MYNRFIPEGHLSTQHAVQIYLQYAMPEYEGHLRNLDFIEKNKIEMSEEYMRQMRERTALLEKAAETGVRQILYSGEVAAFSLQPDFKKLLKIPKLYWASVQADDALSSGVYSMNGGPAETVFIPTAEFTKKISAISKPSKQQPDVEKMPRGRPGDLKARIRMKMATIDASVLEQISEKKLMSLMAEGSRSTILTVRREILSDVKKWKQK